MLLPIYLISNHLRPALKEPLNRDRFVVRVETNYLPDGSPDEVLVTSQLDRGLQRYFRFTKSNSVLVLHIDRQNHYEEAWLEKSPFVYVSKHKYDHQDEGISSAPSNQKVKSAGTINGIACISISTKYGRYESVTWVNKKDRSDRLAYHVFDSGKLVFSNVVVQSRSGSARDLDLFGFPSSTKRVSGTDKKRKEMLFPFILPPDARIPN